MTPLAFWTGRLPGLRPLPRPWTLWLAGGAVALGTAGAFGLLGQGVWLGLAGSLVAGWTVWRHRWPGRPPRRLTPREAPQGPDERTVIVEFRHEGALLGWDVGILWFERGGVGFAGQTVSFVLPRALMHTSPWRPFADTALHAPKLVAEVFGTSVAFIPLARSLNAETTIARIDALPHEITSETVLPPTSLHPDLLARGLAVQRRMPYLLTIILFGASGLYLPPVFDVPIPDRPYGTARAIVMLAFVLISFAGFAPIPSEIRDRLPQRPRRRKEFL